MRHSEIGILVLAACSIAAQAQSKGSNRCAALKSATLTRSRDHEFGVGSGGENHCTCLPGRPGAHECER